ncbi:Uncharacterised protein [Vibrio cholerae]|nr:Uncharacterised protein [Vibrio cholerae]CSI45945.1 Uncharacterised protein [Vibrio cholerae]CSI71154.1 Uncharacterised protein [Vibrio cholerae]
MLQKRIEDLVGLFTHFTIGRRVFIAVNVLCRGHIVIGEGLQHRL